MRARRWRRPRVVRRHPRARRRRTRGRAVRPAGPWRAARRRRGQHRVDLDEVAAAAQAEQPLDHQPQRQARAGGVDPPAALERHLAGHQRGVALRGVVAVGEDAVGGGVVAAALTRPGLRHPVGQSPRAGQREGPQQRGAVADAGQRLGVAEVRVDVHQADLAAPERARLGALEDRHRTAAVGHRAVEEPGPVRAEQVLLDHREVVARRPRGRARRTRPRAPTAGCRTSVRCGCRAGGPAARPRSRPRRGRRAGSRASRPSSSMTSRDRLARARRPARRRRRPGRERRRRRAGPWASASSACTWRTAVHVDARRRARSGSAGWSESFQSPWP